MLTSLRRVLLLWLFMLWQGGFMFYGAIVVPIGTDLFGLSSQGDLTRQVTNSLNIVGEIVLFTWIWDLLAERSSRLKRRWTLWLFLLTLLALLALLHLRMDALMDLASPSPADHAAFRHWHRWYLRISTVQWIASILFTIATLQNWRQTDRHHPCPPDPTRQRP